MVENLEVGRDGFEIAALDRLAGDGQRALEPEELKKRVIRQVVDLFSRAASSYPCFLTLAF